MHKNSIAYDSRLLQRYAKALGYSFDKIGFKGIAIGVRATSTNSREAYIESRGITPRYQFGVFYLSPKDRKACFDFLLNTQK